MENSSLISLINSFNPKELKSLREFLISPYFNKNKNVVSLFDFIASKKTAERAQITNRELHSHIFKGKKYSEENIKTIIYLLRRLSEKFLVAESIENDNAEQTKRLLRCFDERGNDKLFEKHVRKSANNTEEADLNTIYEQSEFEKTLIEFYTKRNHESEIYRHELKLSEYLITAFFIDMFKQANLFWRFSYLNETGHDFTTSLLNTIDLKLLFKTFDEQKFTYKELLVPYYNIYCYLDDDEKVDFKTLKESITGNSFISDNEKFVLSTMLVNTLYYKNLKVRNKYDNELFEAFKLLLELYKYSGEQYLRSTIFSNVIRMGLQTGNYDWTENFIRTSHTQLDPAVKENMFHYSNAYLSFAKGDFEKCLEFESKINYETFQQRYYLRDLRLCSLYELSRFENALSLIDAYKHFIKNDRSFKPKMKQGYLLFLSFMNDLIKIRLGSSKKDLYAIKDKLGGANPMRKEWLVKKYKEL